MTIIDGKATAKKTREAVAERIAALTAQGKRPPSLAVILVGEDPASSVYVNNKEKDCAEVGIKSLPYHLPETTTEQELLSIIDKLNADDTVDGILVQLPLPKHLDEDIVIKHIDPQKDVDAFSEVNVGKITLGKKGFLPCTPAGVMKLLEEYNIEVGGKNCVVIGRSNIVGKPMALLLLAAGGTVTICHSKTKDLAAHTKEADILVVATGRPKMVTKEMVKEGATIIDVGINRVDGKLCGDVDYEEVSKIASYITPVPGGVGPMTRAMLLENTFTAYNSK